MQILWSVWSPRMASNFRHLLSCCTIDWNVDIKFLWELKNNCGNLLLEKNRQLPHRTRTCHPQDLSAWMSHCAIAKTCVLMMRLWYLQQTDVHIIIITYRPRLLLLKPEWADGAVAGKDSSIKGCPVSPRIRIAHYLFNFSVLYWTQC